MAVRLSSEKPFSFFYFLSENKIITSKLSNMVLDQSYQLIKLWHTTDNVLLNMDSGRLTGAVSLDLLKEFDTVDHNLLLDKFKSVRLLDDTLNWLQSQNTKDVCRIYLREWFTILSVCQWNYSLRWWHYNLLLID